MSAALVDRDEWARGFVAGLHAEFPGASASFLSGVIAVRGPALRAQGMPESYVVALAELLGRMSTAAAPAAKPKAPKKAQPAAGAVVVVPAAPAAAPPPVPKRKRQPPKERKLKLVRTESAVPLVPLP